MGCHNQWELNWRCGRVPRGCKNKSGTCKFDSMIKYMKKQYVALICMS